MLRLGKFHSLRGPGLFWIVPFIDTITDIIDQRTVTANFDAEQTLTADTAPVNVDAVLFWVVTDVKKAALEVLNYRQAVSWAAQTALRYIIERTSLVDLLHGREKIERELQALIDERSTPWGMTVQSVEMRDITSGRVVLDGINTQENAYAVKERIGIQLQSSAFFPNLSLVELLGMFSDLYGQINDPMQLLREVGLLEKANAFVKDLSGGQKQRFSIATTLVNKPIAIFLDEPTTGLDPQARRNLWELITQIKSKGTTIIITTHYMDEAQILCDRVAIMDDGKIVALDTPENLIDQLLSRGFKANTTVPPATLEDVFIDLTGKELRD